MAKFGNIRSVWSTVREINVGDIREEAEQPITVAVIGDPAARAPIVQALRGEPGRFPLLGQEALRQYDLPLRRDQPEAFREAALIILALQGDAPPPVELERAADRLSLVQTPSVVACVGAERLPTVSGAESSDLALLPPVFLPNPDAPDFADRLAERLVEHIPAELRLAAARSVPGLRAVIANGIIGDTSLSNATYSLTSGLPEMIPLLNIPLNAADMVVLTKNQALMVYRLGLAFGATGDFQSQMREILPVIGSGFAWRQVARQLIGLVPGFGLVPKVAVAYAGTYATGQAALIWYRHGEALSRDALNRLYKQALDIGRQRAAGLLARNKRERGGTGETQPLVPVKRGWRRFLPGGSRPPSGPEK